MANLTLSNEWVEGIYQLETSDPVIGGPDGIDNRQAKQLGARTNWLKGQVDNLNQEKANYAPKANPTFTGSPKAPTPSQTTNDTTLATTAFVKTAIAALVGSAPAALDTLAEIATALGNDGNIKSVLLAEIAKKANQTDFTALHDLFIGVPIPHPLSSVPEGCLAMNGQRFDTSRYPKLAQKYPSGTLPDLRGEFIRGWDNGRGVDAGRGILSAQGDAIRNITGKHRATAYLDNDYTTGAFSNTPGAGGEGEMMHRALYTNDPVSVAVEFGKYNELIVFDASASGVPVANENRPRNIAFHYICLAA